jgi:hypothetical protein
VIAVAGAAGGWSLLLPGAAAFGAAMLLVLLRAWPQSQPWAWWLGAALLALVLAAVNLGGHALGLAGRRRRCTWRPPDAVGRGHLPGRRLAQPHVCRNPGAGGCAQGHRPADRA